MSRALETNDRSPPSSQARNNACLEYEGAHKPTQFFRHHLSTDISQVFVCIVLHKVRVKARAVTGLPCTGLGAALSVADLSVCLCGSADPAFQDVDARLCVS